MIKRIDYRIAANLFLFAGLWLVLGAIILWSPVPGALGISSELFAVWVLLLFAVTAIAGGALVAASYNAAFSERQGRAARPARSAHMSAPRGAAAGPDVRPTTGAERQRS